MSCSHRILGAALVALGTTWLTVSPVMGSEFSEPWKRQDRALVVDAYEYNSIDWQKLVSDDRIAGFINKASDGLAPAYDCEGTEEEIRLCKTLWKRHAVARELYHTRRIVAKALGLKWGAYHLGRPGNPIEQANNFLDFAEPGPDDLIALDIEDNDPEKWISLEDAEEFARHIRRRTGRYPILYTNDNTANHIAANRERYRLLSRLPLWYARYKPEIGDHFPKGHWQSYALWQFSTQANCTEKSCPYRVPGTPLDIDVNVASMSAEALRAAWPFGSLLDTEPDAMASIPVPFPRKAALATSDVILRFAPVEANAAIPSAFASLLAAGKEPVGEPSASSPDELIEVASPAFGYSGEGHSQRVETSASAAHDADDDRPRRIEPDDLASLKPNGRLQQNESASARRSDADVELSKRIAEAIERGFSEMVVARSIVRAAKPVEAPAFTRSAMPIFLLNKPVVPAVPELSYAR
jgi:GH25 family lysozyme M1 (1,4-beta-N-acetylmuramidase)